MSKQEFLKMVKDFMRNYKNQWLKTQVEVEGHIIEIHLFNKSVPTFKIDGMHAAIGWDIPTQKEVIERIDRYLKEVM